MTKLSTLYHSALPQNLFPASFILLILTGCKHADQDRPAYMTQIFQVVGALPEDNMKQIAALDSAFSLIKDPGIEDRLDVYAFKCAFYQRQRHFAEAFNYADSMIDLTIRKTDQTKYAKWYASALASKGDIYLAIKNYDESFLCYTKSRVIAERVATDTCGMRSGYTQRLAHLLYKQKKFEAAAAHFKLAVREIDCSTVSNEFLSFVYTQSSLDNVGMCYARLNEWDSALSYFEAAMRYIVENESKFPARREYIQTAKAVVWGNLAGFYAQQNNAAQAESLYVKSIAVWNRHNNSFGQGLQLELANLLVSENRFAEAGKLLDQVNDSLHTLPDEDNRLRYFQAMAAYHLKRGETGASVSYLQKYIAFKDSADERNKRFTSVDIITDMEKRYQEAINETLKKENELKQLYLVIAVLTGVMLIIVFSFLLYNSRKSARFNSGLALRQERERISKELHDDLGSTLTSLQILVKKLSGGRQLHSPETMKNILQVSEGAIDQIGEIVWMLNDSADTLNGLFAHLRVYMADYIEKTGLALSLDFKKNCRQDCPLTHLQRRNLLLSIKEIFHNVVKHSGASVFSIEWACDENSITVIAADNGAGFAESKTSAGNGLRNIKKRVADIQGQLSIRRGPGVEMQISFPADRKIKYT